MTTVVDIINRALQMLGTRTNVDAAELAAETSNEAIQANLSVTNIRQDLLRMAPWNCATITRPLVYITSAPGTPENQMEPPEVWGRGLPPPPWLYEYQYPVDCLRPCYILPQPNSQGIFGQPAVGYRPPFPPGPPINYKVATDYFPPIIRADIEAPGTGYLVNDILYLTDHETYANGSPVGAPPVLRVTSVDPVTLGVTGVEVMTQVPGHTNPPYGGSYFARTHNSTRIGVRETIRFGSPNSGPSGAEFSFDFAQPSPQRVILTNQRKALLTYIWDVDDPGVMDTLFQSAWAAAIAAKLAVSLTGDKALAQFLEGIVNRDIQQARTSDGNEGMTVNDTTPDWLRARGIDYNDWGMTFPDRIDWGPMWSVY